MAEHFQIFFWGSYTAAKINRPAYHGDEQRYSRLIDLDVVLQNNCSISDEKDEYNQQALPANDLHILLLIIFMVHWNGQKKQEGIAMLAKRIKMRAIRIPMGELPRIP